MSPPRRQLKPRVAALQPSQRSWLRSFLEYVANERQLSPNTCFAYRSDLIAFYRWLGDRSIPALSVQDLAEYAAACGYTPTVTDGNGTSTLTVTSKSGKTVLYIEKADNTILCWRYEAPATE
jgi:hypothetical protein